MRAMTTMLLAALLPSAAVAQGSSVISHTEARQFTGETVTVEGPVAKAARGAGGTIWLSLGQPHPKATLVIVVPRELVEAIGDPASWEGKVVQVNGRINRAGAAMPAGPNGERGNSTAGSPRTPFLLLGDMGRLRVVQRPDTSLTAPRAR